MLANVAMMLLGALLVVVGVLAGAVGDRIRGNRAARERAAPRRANAKGAADVAPVLEPFDAMGRDVVTALVGAGYNKDEAIAAARACPGSARATLESWTRAALGQCSPLRRTA